MAANALAATSRAGWTAALGGSLLLHAGVAAALLPLIDGVGRKAPPTAISFSEPPPDVLASLPQRSETLGPVSTRSEAEQVGDAAPMLPASSGAPPLSPLASPAEAGTALPAEQTAAEATASTSEPLAAQVLAAASSPATTQPAAPQTLPSLPAAQQAEPEQAEAAEVPQASVALQTSSAAVASPLAVPQTEPLITQGAAASAAPVEAAPLQAAAVAGIATAPLPAEQIPALAPSSAAAPLDPVAIAETPSIAPLAASAAPPAEVLTAISETRSSEPVPAASAPLLPVVSEPLPSAPAVPASAPTVEPSTAPASGETVVAQAAPLARSGEVAPEAAEIAGSPASSGEGSSVPLAPVAAETVGGDVSAALAPSLEPLQPEQPEDDAALETSRGVLQPLPRAPETVASAAGAAGDSGAALPDGATDERNARLRKQAVAFARGFKGGDCFAVVPSPAAKDDTVGFDAFSRNGEAMQQFAEAARALGANTTTSFGNLSEPQCRALLFARSLRNYPDFTLSIALESARIPDHASLAGRINNTAGQETQLLLIDDEGTVQTVERFPAADGDKGFSVQMNLTAGQVRTKQLLMAVSADRPLHMLAGSVNMKAPVFFSQLGMELIASGAKLDLALQAFDVGATEAAPVQATGGELR